MTERQDVPPPVIGTSGLSKSYEVGFLRALLLAVALAFLSWVATVLLGVPPLRYG